MNIMKFKNGLEIKVKRLTFYYRILKNVVPMMLFYFLFLYFYFIFENKEISIKSILLLTLPAILFVLMIILYHVSLKWYYIYNVNIRNNKCDISYYINAHKKEISFDLLKVVIQRKERVIVKGTIDIIEISENNKIILEIWPDLNYFGKQWKQEDIYELYDILIDYQNKLKEKQNSEQETT